MPKGVYPRTEEHKRKISESLKGKKLSKEHKEKISKSLKNNPPFKGKHHSKKAKKKMSEAHKGKIPSNSKTTKKEREKITELFLTGKYSQSDIANIFNLNQSNVSSIIVKNIYEEKRKKIISKILSKKIKEAYANGSKKPAKTNLFEHGYFYSEKTKRKYIIEVRMRRKQ